MSRDKLLDLLAKYSILVLLFACSAVFAFKLYHLKGVEFVGHGDSAGYAAMAKSVLLGKGFAVDYIQTFFTPYNSVHRPQDLWYPFNSIIIIPFYFFFGVSAFAAKIPNTVLACYGLPLLTYILAKELCRGDVENYKPLALFAALAVLLNPAVWMESLTVYAEVLLAFLHTGAILFFIKGLEKKWWFLAMGAFVGLTVLTKLTGFLLLAALVLSFLLTRSYKNWKLFLASLVIAVLAPFPWFVRNWASFGDPFYSLTKYYGGLGIEEGPGYEEDYRIYWDKEKPSVLKKIEDMGLKRYAFHVFNNFAKAMKIAFLGYDARDFGNIKYLLSNKFETFIFGLPSLAGLFLLRKNREVIPIYVIAVSYVLVFSLFWFPLSRYFTLAIPGVVLTGVLVYGRIVGGISARLMPHRRMSRVLASLLVLSCALLLTHSFRVSTKVGWYPHGDSGEKVLLLSKWLKENTSPEDVVMTTFPVELNFHSERPTIQIPFEDFDKIVMVMSIYDVKYLVPDFENRPALKEILRHPEMFRPLNVDGLVIYAIKLPFQADQGRWQSRLFDVFG